MKTQVIEGRQVDPDSNLSNAGEHFKTSKDTISETVNVLDPESPHSALHPEATIEAYNGWFKTWMATVEKANIESRGIERVEPQDRYPQSVWDGFTMWAGANFTASTFATGALGPLLGLGFWDSFIIIIIVNSFAPMLTALFGTFGPLTGLRTITISRYSFGVWGSRLICIFNILSCVGWAAVNAIAGAQILLALSDGKVPLWAGNLIIGLLVMVTTVFGYKVIHFYERYSWIPQVIIFCILAGYGARYFDTSAFPIGSGPGEVTAALSFISILYGFSAGWATFSADYNVNMPENTSKLKLGLSIWCGNVLSLCLPEILGAAFITTIAANDDFSNAFDNAGYGGIMGQALSPLGGFGKFLLVITAISVVGCNIVNCYSLAFSVQCLGDWALKVPRFVWTALGSAAFIIVSIAGRESLVPFLESFLSIIGYYYSAYFCAFLIEHFYFRRGRYPLDDWNNPKLLPVGYAGAAALCMGFVGAVLGMNQNWYQGPISSLIQPTGGELGWIMSGLFASITYVPARMLEMKWVGR